MGVRAHAAAGRALGHEGQARRPRGAGSPAAKRPARPAAQRPRLAAAALTQAPWSLEKKVEMLEKCIYACLASLISLVMHQRKFAVAIIIIIIGGALSPSR